MPYVKHLRVLQAGPYLPNLRNLEQLVLTKLEGCDKYLTQCKSLQFLKIDFCRDENNGFNYDSISLDLKNLKTLHVRYRYNINNMFFSRFTNLEELCLVWCPQITDNVFTHMPKLERLYLRCNENLTGEMFKFLPNLKLLHYEDQGEMSFEHLSNLETLNITLKYTDMNIRNRIKEEEFRHLVNLKDLTIYHSCGDLYNCRCNITSNVFTRLPKLNKLNLYRCNHLLTKQTFDILPTLDTLYINFGYDEVCLPYEKNRFNKLKVKHIILDYGFKYAQRKDLKHLIKNGTQTLSVIKDEYQETRFSPLFQEKIILSGRDILRFFKIKRITNHSKYKEDDYMKRKQLHVNRRLEKEPYFFKL
jgi:hypothetical protein